MFGSNTFTASTHPVRNRPGSVLRRSQATAERSDFHANWWAIAHLNTFDAVVPLVRFCPGGALSDERPYRDAFLDLRVGSGSHKA
jgi:hypothetical protein